MNKYVIAIMAIRRKKGGQAASISVCRTEAVSKEEAHGIAMKECHEHYPESEGFHSHLTSLPVEI